jgi:uncharacterized Rmd1/YagE family protein
MALTGPTIHDPLVPNDAGPLRVVAYALPATVPVQKLATLIDLPVVASDRKHVILGEGTRSVVAYDFGALVLVGPVGDVEQKALRAWSSLTGEPDREPTTEDFTIAVEPGKSVETRFDRLVVAELTPSVIDIVAQVVGQSASLEHLETEVDRILERLRGHAHALRTRGRFFARKRDLLKFIGAGLGLSNRAVLTLSILDPPLASWNDETLDRIQRGLRDAFGIEERYRALDHKLSKIHASLELMVDLIHHARSLALETTIVILILVEIVLFFLER